MKCQATKSIWKKSKAFLCATNVKEEREIKNKIILFTIVPWKSNTKESALQNRWKANTKKTEPKEKFLKEKKKRKWENENIVPVYGQ